ncbi:MAG: hypothetical protein ACRELG_01275 [Gemmataceae bacterium]
MNRAKISVLLLGILPALAGCSSKPVFVPVEGKVLQGGKPLAGVIVEFHPETDALGPRSTSGPTNEAGHYRLRGLHGEDGAVVGVHHVCLFDTRGLAYNIFGRLPKKRLNSKEYQDKVARIKIKIEDVWEPASPSLRIPTSYNRPNETPLRIEIRPGQTEIDLEDNVIKLEIRFGDK